MKKKIALLTLLSGLSIFTLAGCASWERGLKDIGSDLGGGLNRTVEVYDYSGNLLKTYEGKLDIEDSSTISGKVKFDMNGKRYIVYNAIVVVEEK